MSAIHKATRLLAHRGPDGEGAVVLPGDGIALGHRRLSILDVSDAASQPMTSPSSASIIVFNGEIYNYIERRRELQSEEVLLGASTGDTEVLIALIEQYGPAAVDRLRGMFAFGLWNAREKSLLLARDRIGKKPLYYSCVEGRFCFGSEIKAVATLMSTPPTIDWDSLDEYLSFGFIAGPRTVYREIQEVPPGCLLLASAPDHWRVTRYWEPRWEPKRNIDLASAVAETKELLAEAIRLRLRSDVPIGLLLSGGLDSSLIASILAEVLRQPCKTFSVGFLEKASDERPLARLVAERCGHEYHEIILQPDVTRLIPKVAWHYDQPFGDPSAIPAFAISEYISHHVKVVLNGDGGDEMFGGYRRHVASVAGARLADSRTVLAVADKLRRLTNRLGAAGTKRDRINLLLDGILADAYGRFQLWYGGSFTNPEKQILLKKPSSRDSVRRVFDDLQTQLPDLGKGDRAMALDLVWELPGCLLVKMDRATMAYGIEARSPFLDQEIITCGNLFPENVRLSGHKTKPVLRALAEQLLPPVIARAPKRGFELPLKQWLQTDLLQLRDDLILSSSGIVCSMFKRATLEELVCRSKLPDKRWANCVWTLLMLAAWDRYCTPAPQYNEDPANIPVTFA